MADAEQFIPRLDSLMSIRGMAMDLTKEHRGILGALPLMAIALVSPHTQVGSESTMLDYVKNLGPELAVSAVIGFFWGEYQFVRAKGKRTVYENLEAQRKQASEQFEGAFTLMDSAKPTTEAEALKLNNDVVAAVTKKLDPRTPPKDIDTTIKNVVALYQAKDEIRQGKQSSSGVRMWYEVVKEGAQAAILGFSATALVNLFVTFGIPVMTQESVAFAISNAESAAQATRWVSMVPLFGLALREVLRSRYKDPEFYAKGLESRLGGHH